MPHINIDGQRIETSANKTIIEAAYDNSMEVPHFCWHPELKVAGNCRMCLVEVGSQKKLPNGEFEFDSEGNPIISYFPKLQIACATPVAEGMYVRAASDVAIEAQEAVMEFLLINHPLDCPICDEAGECKLQEYAFKHSNGESRFDEQKNHKEKRQHWGPNVIFDAERCISCSRCIRFAQDVAKQDVLTFVQRGDHVTIDLFDGTVFDSPYSMNVIELCPVGALTSPDFRFKARVWDMSFNDSISIADGSGSNTRLGVRNNEILRIEPRTNPYVNKYWLTDDARLNHHHFVNENRLTEPYIRKNGNLNQVTWDEAFSEAASLLNKYKPSEIMFIGSAMATNEDNFILQKFAKTIVKSNNLDFYRYSDENFADNLIGVADRLPNTHGAQAVGIEHVTGSTSHENLAERINMHHIKCVFIMEENFKHHSDVIEILRGVETVISLQYNNNVLNEFACVLFPASTFAEIEGTYTNVKNRVQHITPALVTKDNLRIMGMKMSRLDKFGSHNDRWTSHQLRNCRQSWKIIQGIASVMGANWHYHNSSEVFHDIESSIGAFKGMSYQLLDEYQGLVLNKADRPDPKVLNYVSHVMKPAYQHQ